jgi:hypothetical protein
MGSATAAPRVRAVTEGEDGATRIATHAHWGRGAKDDQGNYAASKEQ